MTEAWIEVASTVTGLAVAAALLFGTGPGRRWAAWSRSRLPTTRPHLAAFALAMGVLLASAVVLLLRGSGAFEPLAMLNAILLAFGAGTLGYFAFRRPATHRETREG